MQEITQTKSGSSTGMDWWDPDFEPDEFRRLGYQAVDMMVDYFATIRDRPVFPGVLSEVVAEAFNDPLPWTGQPADQILEGGPAQPGPCDVHRPILQFQRGDYFQRMHIRQQCDNRLIPVAGFNNQERTISHPLLVYNLV